MPNTRTDTILELLSNEELATVSTVELADRLAYGDEYVDLGNVERGVGRASDLPRSLENLLARSAVGDHTWRLILAQLV